MNVAVKVSAICGNLFSFFLSSRDTLMFEIFSKLLNNIFTYIYLVPFSKEVMWLGRKCL